MFDKDITEEEYIEMITDRNLLHFILVIVDSEEFQDITKIKTIRELIEDREKERTQRVQH